MPHSACNGLVRVAVDVSSDGGAKWSRHASVVDTGCTTSLVELALVRRLGLLRSVRDSNESLLTIQGHTLNTSGCVDVMMRRLDGHVYLPHICATLVVVEDLAALNTDILLGADIAAKTGGVNIAYETPGGRLSSVVFGTRLDVIGAGVASSSKLSSHLSVKENDDAVTLEMTDVSVTWSGSAGYREPQWTWKDGTPPSSPLGCGIGEYPRSKLSSTGSVPPTRPVSPSGPREVVQLDTLELGPSRSGRYHCVLVCVDTFTKWVEVQPLERHDAQSVAAAFVSICCRWGAPQ